RRRRRRSSRRRDRARRRSSARRWRRSRRAAGSPGGPEGGRRRTPERSPGWPRGPGPRPRPGGADGWACAFGLPGTGGGCRCQRGGGRGGLQPEGSPGAPRGVRHDAVARLLRMADFDVVVLGAGPGGYVAAIRAAQLGKSVAVVEKKYWGGVCLNVGCIPSKALIKNAELAHTLTHEKKTFGIECDVTMSYGATHARSRKVSDGIVKGVHFLMKKNKITEIGGWGTISGTNTVDVALNDGETRQVSFDKLIIASGATTNMLPGVEVSDNVVTYEELILDEHLPGSMIIAGSGAIGVEFAYVMKNFGVDVTIVEFLDRMVPTEDAAVSKELLKHYKKLGVKVMLSTKVDSVEDTGSGVK